MNIERDFVISNKSSFFTWKEAWHASKPLLYKRKSPTNALSNRETVVILLFNTISFIKAIFETMREKSFSPKMYFINAFYRKRKKMNARERKSN